MYTIKKHFIFIALVLFYLIFRLFNLTKLPIFGDEAIYLDWGWRQIHIPGLLFYSVTDAKQPLLLWLFGIIQSFPGDPLWQGRFVVVLFGLAAIVGIYLLAKKYFDQKTAVIAVLLYTLIPLFSFFDRQALMETPVSAVSILVIYAFFELLQSQKLKNVLILAFLISINYYLKTSSILYLAAISLIAIFEWYKHSKKERKNLIYAFLGVFLTSQIILLPLYLKPAFWQSLATNSRYVLSLQELSRLPFPLWINNLINSLVLMFWHLTPIITIALLLGTILIIKTKETFKIYSLFILILINVLFIFLTRSAIPRYEVSLLPLVCIVAAYTFVQLLKESKINAMILGFLASIIPVGFTLLQIISPLSYFSLLQNFTAQSQHDLYVSNWTSGYGVIEVEQYLQEKARSQTIHVGVRLDSGNPENSMFVYNNKSAHIIPMYLDGRVMDKQALKSCFKASTPVYFVSRNEDLAFLNRNFSLIKRFYKPEGNEYIGLYILRTDCQGKTLTLPF